MSREYVATLNDVEIAVRVNEAAGATWSATVDGRSVLVEAHALGQGAYSIRIEHRHYLVIVDAREQGVELSVQGNQTRISFVDAAVHAAQKLVMAKAESDSGDEAVRAPIAGRVVKLLVSVGQTVDRGDGVIVVEAMKMENEIRSEKGGRVEAVHVTQGASIENGQLLVTLKQSA
jgi:biotin carboxyl carrier protein